jgi:hypothetical protein
MEDWASRAARRFADEQRAERLRHQRALMRQKLVEKQGSKLWAELRAMIEEEIQKFNTEAGKNILVSAGNDDNKLIIFLRAVEQRELTATLNTRDYTIDYRAQTSSEEAPDKSGKFTLGMTDDNMLVLLDLRGVKRSLQGAASQILNALMAWNR